MLKQYDEMTPEEQRIFDQAMEVCDQMAEARKHNRFNPDDSPSEQIMRQQFFAGII